MSESLQKQDGPGALSDREREVWEWIAHGKTNWEIGRILGLSKETVKKHVQRICHCLDVPNRTAAATMYGRLEPKNAVPGSDASTSMASSPDSGPLADIWP